MVTLGQIKQDYKEITNLISNCKTLNDLKSLSKQLQEQKTNIEINGTPLKDIKSLEDSNIDRIKIDGYKSLCDIYFNEWQSNEPKVMFDAYLGVNECFIEEATIDTLDDEYLEYIKYFMDLGPEPITPDVMADLAESNNWKCRREAAKNEKTPTNVLLKLAESKDWEVRWGVAKNPKTPAEILERLADDSKVDVRMEVALNPSTHVDVLQKLSNDESNFVRQAITKNKNTPTNTEIKLSEYIQQLDDVIETCQKLKEALINGEVDLDKSAFNKSFDR